MCHLSAQEQTKHIIHNDYIAFRNNLLALWCNCKQWISNLCDLSDWLIKSISLLLNGSLTYAIIALIIFGFCSVTGIAADWCYTMVHWQMLYHRFDSSNEYWMKIQHIDHMLCWTYIFDVQIRFYAQYEICHHMLLFNVLSSSITIRGIVI
jgi:hypothetical protein